MILRAQPPFQRGNRSLRRRAGWALLPVLLALPLGFAPHPARAALSGVFTVSDVPVEADGKTATRARETARAEGQAEALNELLHRLTLESGWSHLPQPDAGSITDMVLAFQVQKEHMRPTHYNGIYTFRFDAAAVRNLLTEAHVNFSELASKPVVLVPLLQNGGAAHLWDDPNPWRDAWNNANGKVGLVPWIVPLGDIGDVESFDTAQAKNPSANDVAALSQKYDNGDPVVAQAVESDSPDKAELAITVTRYSSEGVLTGTTSVSGPKPNAALYESGIIAARELMEGQWKQIVATNNAGLAAIPGAAPPPGQAPPPGAVPPLGSIPPGANGAASVGAAPQTPEGGFPSAIAPNQATGPTGGPSVVTAEVNISDLGQWARIQDKLSHVDGVVQQNIVMMSTNQVVLRLSLNADPASLALSFAQEDLVLQPAGDGTYALRLDANAAARLVPTEMGNPNGAASPMQGAAPMPGSAPMPGNPAAPDATSDGAPMGPMPGMAAPPPDTSAAPPPPPPSPAYPPDDSGPAPSPDGMLHIPPQQSAPPPAQ